VRKYEGDKDYKPKANRTINFEATNFEKMGAC
jgi:hypothetical protein